MSNGQKSSVLQIVGIGVVCWVVFQMFITILYLLSRG